MSLFLLLLDERVLATKSKTNVFKEVGFKLDRRSKKIITKYASLVSILAYILLFGGRIHLQAKA